MIDITVSVVGSTGGPSVVKTILAGVVKSRVSSVVEIIISGVVTSRVLAVVDMIGSVVAKLETLSVVDIVLSIVVASEVPKDVCSIISGVVVTAVSAVVFDGLRVVAPKVFGSIEVVSAVVAVNPTEGPSVVGESEVFIRVTRGVVASAVLTSVVISSADVVGSKVIVPTLVECAVLNEVASSEVTSIDVETTVVALGVVDEVDSGAVVSIVAPSVEIVSKDVKPVVAVELTSSVGVRVVDNISSVIVEGPMVVRELIDDTSVGAVDFSMIGVDVSIVSDVLSGVISGRVVR